MIQSSDIERVLATVIDPEQQKDLITLKRVRSIRIDELGKVTLDVVFPLPERPSHDTVRQVICATVKKISGVSEVKLQVISESPAPQKAAETKAMPAGIKQVIAVASGKGGVGKSTTSVNLAVALKQTGARVGLLDADVYGPNIPMMMGIPETERPSLTEQDQMIPFENHGIRVMSLAFLVDPGKAVIWRGPIS